MCYSAKFGGSAAMSSWVELSSKYDPIPGQLESKTNYFVTDPM